MDFLFSVLALMKSQMVLVGELAYFRPFDKKYGHEEVMQGLKKEREAFKDGNICEQFNSFTNCIKLSTVIAPCKGNGLILSPKLD